MAYERGIVNTILLSAASKVIIVKAFTVFASSQKPLTHYEKESYYHVCVASTTVPRMVLSLVFKF